MKIRWRLLLLAAAVCVAVGAAGLLILYRQGVIAGQTVPVTMDKTMNAAKLENLTVISDTTDITFAKSASDELRISLSGETNESAESDLRLNLTPNSDGTSAVAEVKTVKHVTVGIDLNQILSLFHNRLKMTVELPDHVYRSLKAKTDTGDITMSNLQADSLEINTDTGEVILDGFKGQRLSGTSDTGTMRLSRIASSVNLNSDTGDFHLDLTKLTGDINITTDTGDIDLTLAQTAPLSVDFASDTGRTTAESQSGAFELERKEKHRLSGKLNDGGPLIKARSDTGSIRLDVK